MKTIMLFITILLVACGSNSQDMSVEALKVYALNYPVAANPDEMHFELEKLPDEIDDIARRRKIDNEFELYVSIILARHYRSHIANANQSYIIDKKHPLWKAFEKFSNIEFQPEYELSNVIYYNWLDPNREKLATLLLVEYEAIRNEHIRIDNAVSAMER
jgi:hypothetical protein